MYRIISPSLIRALLDGTRSRLAFRGVQEKTVAAVVCPAVRLRLKELQLPPFLTIEVVLRAAFTE